LRAELSELEAAKLAAPQESPSQKSLVVQEKESRVLWEEERTEHQRLKRKQQARLKQLQAESDDLKRKAARLTARLAAAAATGAKGVEAQQMVLADKSKVAELRRLKQEVQSRVKVCRMQKQALGELEAAERRFEERMRGPREELQRLKEELRAIRQERDDGARKQWDPKRAELMRLQEENVALEKQLKKKEREKARAKAQNAPAAKTGGGAAAEQPVTLNRDSLLYQLDKLKSMHAWRVRSFKRTIERYDVQIEDCRAQTEDSRAKTEQVQRQIATMEEEIEEMEAQIATLSKIAKKRQQRS
jgi:predicted  nucleic acid-binding Zn-ribbon protein